MGISSNASAQYLIARATRMAERTGGEVFVVYVDIGADQSPENNRTRRVIVRGEEVHLSPKEFDPVAYWARHPHKVVTHRALFAAVWADTPTAQADHLRVFVNHLRKKLEAETVQFVTFKPNVG